MEFKIIWDTQAINQFLNAIDYIENSSPANAEKVKREILLKIDALLKYPEIHRVDKYKLDNDGTFRAFEMHRYRVTYCVLDSEIRILRIRHTIMNPLYY